MKDKLNMVKIHLEAYSILKSLKALKGISMSHFTSTAVIEKYNREWKEIIENGRRNQ